VDRTGSGSRPMVVCGITGVESLGSPTTLLVICIYLLSMGCK